MNKDWKTYCLMSSISYIEEMSKPTTNIQIKKYKNKKYLCRCFHPIRLKMKDPEFIKNFFYMTLEWEKKRGIVLLSKKTRKPSKEKGSGQDQIFFSPIWINHLLVEVGKIPNKYSYETAIKRINSFKQYKKIKINQKSQMADMFFKNKTLAAGAFIVSMDLEFRGIQSGAPSLCMSEKYKDFLKFMLEVAKRWNWTKNKRLSKVNIKNSLDLGIRASPQYEFRLSIEGLKEIYSLVGPLINKKKDKCIKFHVNRSKNYINKGSKNKINQSKEKIIDYLKSHPNSSSTDLQFITNTRVDVVLDRLHTLEKMGKLTKKRDGKRYLWKLKCL